jgi:energy-coupling factor transporter transmembrane protein EcfT
MRPRGSKPDRPRGSNPERRRPAPAITDVNLLRYVARSSAIHDLWAGTKLISLVLVGIALSFRPAWASEGVVLVWLASALLLSRVPLTALPRFPRWFWLAMGITGLLALLAGGKPDVHLFGLVLGVGGLDAWARFIVLIALLITMTVLVGWTTRMGDLAPALSTLLAPARWVRVPVDDVVVVCALAVRCLPLLLDEMRTLYAARRVRRPQPPDSLRELVQEVQDLLATALITSVRRAQEMADAIEARGGVGSVTPSRPRRSVGEAVALGSALAVVAGVVLA